LIDARIVVVGTAGHVDHGKSTLVKALTGHDPDRLAEEKARGLTIDLGFAWTGLPSGLIASFIDVPGHEDFIRNMLAGAAGVQVALLVIAADEGPMPQTREHLAILDLLGVSRGVVALTKSDLAPDADWLALVTESVNLLTADTGLAAAPVIPVSVVSGMGLAALASALDDAAAGGESLPDRGRARLPVDRAFHMQGFGTVVTGTLRDGRMATGDAVVIGPHGREARIRGVQVHGAAAEVALPGSRVALNLSGVEVGEVVRGDWILSAALRPTRLVDVHIRALAGPLNSLEHGSEVHVHHGAAHIPGWLRVVAADDIPPGESGFAQLVLAADACLWAGDRFVLRRPSPGGTLGGGIVLHARPPRRWARFRDKTKERFIDLAAGHPDDIAWHAVALAQPCAAADLHPADTGLETTARDAALERLRETGRLRRLGGRHWMTDSLWARLCRRAGDLIGRHHQRYPLRSGLPREELRNRLGLAPDTFASWLAEAAAAGELVAEADIVRMSSHQGQPDVALESGMRGLLARFAGNERFQPPGLVEARAAVGDEAVGYLIQRGELVPIGGDIALSQQAYQEVLALLAERLADNAEMTVADLRDALSTSRKFALAIFEHSDRMRLTRRVGDTRVAGPNLGRTLHR
jgi:selenocysteine-specific elongation factor